MKPVPTGFNHVLGNIRHFKQQLDAHLGKYGGSVSSELATRIEYASRLAKSVDDSIVIDLHTKGKISQQARESLGDFLCVLRDDSYAMHEKYLKDVVGGYPVIVGTILEDDPINGSMAVNWEYGRY